MGEEAGPPSWTKYFIPRSIEIRVSSSHLGASKRSAASSSPALALWEKRRSSTSVVNTTVSSVQAKVRFFDTILSAHFGHCIQYSSEMTAINSSISCPLKHTHSRPSKYFGVRLIWALNPNAGKHWQDSKDNQGTGVESSGPRVFVVKAVGTMMTM